MDAHMLCYHYHSGVLVEPPTITRIKYRIYDREYHTIRATHNNSP